MLISRLRELAIAHRHCELTYMKGSIIEPLCEVIGIGEGVEVFAKLIARCIVIAFDGPAMMDPLDQSLNASSILSAFGSCVRPARPSGKRSPGSLSDLGTRRVIDLGQSVFDPVFLTPHIEHVQSAVVGAPFGDIDME